MVTKETGRATVEIEVSLSARDLGRGLHAYRTETRTVTAVATGYLVPAAAAVREPAVDQGVVTSGNLDALRKGSPFVKERVEWFDANLVERVSRFGFDAIFRDLPGSPEPSTLRTTRTFDAAESGRDGVFVRIEPAENVVVDLDGTPLAHAVTFDYVDGGVTESRFDLDALLEHLRGRSDVRFPHVDVAGNVDTFRDADVPAVVDVPSYNREMGDRTLPFVWTPSRELFVAARDEARDRAKASGSAFADLRAAVVSLDLLGLRDAGLHPDERSTPRP